MVSIDKDGEILDIIPMSERFGDGGDFIRTRVNWVGDNEYRFKTTTGFETFTNPDTIFFRETFGIKRIMDDGKLITDVIRIDSNQIKIINE